MRRRGLRRNPAIGTHPDMFEGESPIYVDIATMSKAEIKALPRSAFSQAEFDDLDEALQEYIHENDPDSAYRIQTFVDKFVEQWNAISEDTDYVRSREEDNFSDFLVYHSDRLWEHTSTGEELFEDVSASYGETVAAEVINQAMSDADKYDFEVEPVSDVPAFWRSGEVSASLFVHRNDVTDLVAEMYEDEIAVAIAEVEEDTNRQIDLSMEHLDGRYDVELDFDVNLELTAEPDWDLIREEVEVLLEDHEPVEGAVSADEPRIFHTFKDGYFVQDLRANELPAEGRAQGMCVGDPSMGYMRDVRAGKIKILSLRKPNGKPRLTIEVALDYRGNPRIINQAKGKGNRLAGWDQNKTGEGKMKKDEVLKTLEIAKMLGADPGPDLASAMRRLRDEKTGRPPKETRSNPSTHRTCPSCRGTRTGFCKPRP